MAKRLINRMSWKRIAAMLEETGSIRVVAQRLGCTEPGLRLFLRRDHFDWYRDWKRRKWRRMRSRVTLGWYHRKWAREHEEILALDPSHWYRMTVKQQQWVIEERQRKAAA